MTAEDWITHLRLEAHPEGGYFRRTYTADRVLPTLPDRAGSRPVATAIHYLLKSGQRSRLHRLKSDELWYFHAGSPLTVHILEPSGSYVCWLLGFDPVADQQLQIAIRTGCWFGATVVDSGSFSLISCAVAPGFDFADFELADRTTLTRQYPQHAALIERLT
jgi:hypothetical protein